MLPTTNGCCGSATGPACCTAWPVDLILDACGRQSARAQAIGLWGGVVGISFALGPVVGGALVDSVGWRAIFLVNVPIGLVGTESAAPPEAGAPVASLPAAARAARFPE